MQPFFIFKDKDSRDMGVLVNKLPPIIKAEKNIEKIEVQGRNGFLTQDYKTYKPYIKDVECTLVDKSKIDKVCAWLDGSGEVIFSNESDKIYKATIINQIPFYSTLTHTKYRFIINFECQPFKHLKDENEINWEVETTSNSVLGNIVSTNAPCDGMMNIEIGGNTLKNEVLNGDFSKGTEGWTATNASGFSALNGEASFTATYQWGTIRSYANYIANHMYYISASIKADSNDVILGLAKSSGYTVIPAYHSGSGKYEKLSMIGVMPADGIDKPHIKVQDSRPSDWTLVSVKEIMAIDLTAMFGAGNEPTKEWCDANIEWFDGIKSVGEVEGYKIKALSCGKNLFDTNSELIKAATDYYDTVKFNVPAGDIWFKNNYANMSIRSDDGSTSGIQIAYFSPNVDSKMTFVKPTRIFIRLDKVNFDTNLTLNDMQMIISKGTTPTTYEPYKQDKLDILLSKPLTTGSKISGDTVTYADGTTEKLSQPLTLQSFKSGTLQVNTTIPPYIKEWHTTNEKKINIHNNGTFECKPIITICGSGDIVLHTKYNNTIKDILLKNIEDSITINTDIEECYKEYNGVYTEQTNKLYSDFPVFQQGESTITWEGDAQAIKIKKNECYL